MFQSCHKLKTFNEFPECYLKLFKTVKDSYTLLFYEAFKEHKTKVLYISRPDNRILRIKSCAFQILNQFVKFVSDRNFKA